MVHIKWQQGLYIDDFCRNTFCLKQVGGFQCMVNIPAIGNKCDICTFPHNFGDSQRHFIFTRIFRKYFFYIISFQRLDNQGGFPGFQQGVVHSGSLHGVPGKAQVYSPHRPQ